MDEKDVLFTVLKVVTFVIPVGGLIWKAAMQSAKIKELEKSYLSIKSELKELKEQSASDIKEIKDTLNSLSLSFVEIKTSLSFIQKSIEEAKIK